MDFQEIRDYLDQECDFPVTHSTLVELIGDVELDAPKNQSETVGTVLDRSRKTTYRSADEVQEILLGTVTDAYIGRKYYDDRGGAHPPTHERPVLSV